MSERIVRLFLKIFHIKVSDDLVHLLVQIFNFSIVGVVATAIDFLFLYFFRDVCKLDLILANTLAFSISVIFNYYASKRFVFDIDDRKNKSRVFIVFVVFSVIGLVLNDIFVWLFTYRFHIYYLMSKVIATLFVMVFNFVTRKKFLE